MRVAVVDASVLAAVLFVEPEADDVVRRLGGARLAAPALLPYELANVCVQKARRRPAERRLLVDRLARVVDLGISEVSVDAVEVATLALESSLTAYDAAYLWVARSIGAPLISLDADLVRAAHRHGVRVV